MIVMMHRGASIELLLNVLLFADFAKWPQQLIKKFIDFIEQIPDIEEEPNICYKVANPILTICLCCEFLMKIGNTISLFRHLGVKLKEELLSLGEKLVEGIEQEVIRKMYLDTDFFDRTTFKHITDYGYEQLCGDFKVKALLDSLWIGQSYDCNGSITDFSMLTYLMNAPIRKLPDSEI